ncbi:MAG: HNH endonuclease [Chloroflexi bacterium]|nr:HNH endonuclease [Chloroflexota bacterium]
MAVFGSAKQGVSPLARTASDQLSTRATPIVKDDTRCELCRREAERYTVHHLVPRSRGGKWGPTTRLCSTCHRQLHALFSEATLARELHSVDLIRANPEVARFLKWARRQKGDTGFRVRRANNRR